MRNKEWQTQQEKTLNCQLTHRFRQSPSCLFQDETPKNYAFGYAVRDDYTGDDFSHQESRDGYKTSGEYRVALPDGRIQIVTYHADENGYVADVKYEGVAHAPEPYHHAHPVNHAPAAIPQPAALPAAADLPLASRALPPSAPEPVPHHFKSPRPAALPQPIHNEVINRLALSKVFSLSLTFKTQIQFSGEPSKRASLQANALPWGCSPWGPQGPLLPRAAS